MITTLNMIIRINEIIVSCDRISFSKMPSIILLEIEIKIIANTETCLLILFLFIPKLYFKIQKE
jgi:hypothetical protein